VLPAVRSIERSAGVADLPVPVRARVGLELLQNADDAGVGAERCSVDFVLSRERLVIANAGKPFIKDGLASLVISDCSPKQLARNRFIGCKGLGFRSVLAWSERPLISSGDYEVAFDRARAVQHVQGLAGATEEAAGVIGGFYASTECWPAPVMRFPFIPDNEDPELQVARTFRDKGLDTVVVLPLQAGVHGDKAYQDIGQQLASIASSSLLFCRHLLRVQTHLRSKTPRGVLCTAPGSLDTRLATPPTEVIAPFVPELDS